MNQGLFKISEAVKELSVSRWPAYRKDFRIKRAKEEMAKSGFFLSSQTYVAFITILGFLCFSNVATFGQTTDVGTNTVISTSSANDNQKIPDSSDSSDNSYFTLGEVVVTGSATGPLKSQDVLTSVDILGADVVEKQNVDYT